MPSQKELDLLVSYDQATGDLISKVCRGRIHIGDKLGYPTANGYLQLRLTTNGRNYLAHRIIWTLVHGTIPAGMVIDHLNGRGSDNRLANLRLATFAENSKNTKRHKHNSSGVMGVRWVAIRKRWEATIKLNGQKTYLRRFHTFEEAVACRRAAEAQYGYHPNHGRVVE